MAAAACADPQRRKIPGVPPGTQFQKTATLRAPPPQHDPRILGYGTSRLRMNAAERQIGTPQSPPAARALWGALDAAANPLSLLVMLASLVRTLGAADYGVLAIALAASGITMAVNPA